MNQGPFDPEYHTIYQSNLCCEILLPTKPFKRLDVDLAFQVAKNAPFLPPWKRSEILLKSAAILENRLEETAKIITIEAGKPIPSGNWGYVIHTDKQEN